MSTSSFFHAKLTKRFFMSAETGLFIIGNTYHSWNEPILADYIAHPERREIQWREIKRLRCDGRACTVFRTKEDYQRYNEDCMSAIEKRNDRMDEEPSSAEQFLRTIEKRVGKRGALPLSIPGPLGTIEKIVLTFDMWSSQVLMEDLAKHNKLDLLVRFLDEIRTGIVDLDFQKQLSNLYQLTRPVQRYKFTGDGWILVFEPDTSAEDLMEVVYWISNRFWNRFAVHLKEELKNIPKRMGLRIGIDAGALYEVNWDGRQEYIGVPLLKAERLQSAIKDLPYEPTKMLMTDAVYRRIFHALKLRKEQVLSRSVSLEKGQDEATHDCIEISIPTVWGGVLPSSSSRRTSGGKPIE